MQRFAVIWPCHIVNWGRLPTPPCKLLFPYPPWLTPENTVCCFIQTPQLPFLVANPTGARCRICPNSNKGCWRVETRQWSPGAYAPGMVENWKSSYHWKRQKWTVKHNTLWSKKISHHFNCHYFMRKMFTLVSNYPASRASSPWGNRWAELEALLTG